MSTKRKSLSRIAVGIGAWAVSAFACAAPVLYGINDSTNALVTIDRTTGAVATVGSTGVANGNFGDLTYDASHGVMYWSAGRDNGGLYTINRATGAASLIGATNVND